MYNLSRLKQEENRKRPITSNESESVIKQQQQNSQQTEVEDQGLPWWSSGWDCAHGAGDPGSIPGQGTIIHMPQLEIPHVATKTWCGQISDIFKKSRTRSASQVNNTKHPQVNSTKHLEKS